MRLPSPKQLKNELPLNEPEALFIENARQSAQDLIIGKSERIAIIVGPCSIHDPSSALEYAERLKTLSKKVDDNFLLVMRVYAEKPRTALGWKGFLYDPFLDGSHCIDNGIRQTRQLLLNLAEMQVPAAAEFVDPLAAHYIDDLITWGFIGARTSESQPHRQLASSLSMPIGFKNTTDGEIDSAINGVLSASHPHCFLSIDSDGYISCRQSNGNPFTHIVLRGSTLKSNYDISSVQNVVKELKNKNLDPRLMIDCAHGNSGRQYQRQAEIFADLIERIGDGDTSLFGIMLESHLEAGNQVMPLSPSISITDPCIDWETTEELILKAHVTLSRNQVLSH